MVASMCFGPAVGASLKLGSMKGFVAGAAGLALHDSGHAEDVADHNHGAHVDEHGDHPDHAEHDELGEHAEHHEHEDHAEHEENHVHDEDHEREHGEEEMEGAEEAAAEEAELATGYQQIDASGASRQVENREPNSRDTGVASAIASRIAKVTATAAFVLSAASRIIEARSKDLGLTPYATIAMHCMGVDHICGNSADDSPGTDESTNSNLDARAKRGGNARGIGRRRKERGELLQRGH
eukprot:TRINITY_DN31361_c0_g1_i1.p2 TRINITY_DN31361_c0_g1~~TRINITY_DN31361_c0_g1_i1.p2  ORF type:complete len:239 (+),score=52.75 TRINITY_DN31361_c0_g1_i1:266-982(+)